MGKVAVSRVTKERNDDVRSECSNNGNDVLEENIVGPRRIENGVGALRPEIVGACEVLMCAIALTLGEKLLRTHHSERKLPFVASDVRTALPTREGEVRRLDVPSQATNGNFRSEWCVRR